MNSLVLITTADIKRNKSYHALRRLCLAFYFLFTVNGFAQQAYLDSLLLVNESYKVEDKKKMKLQTLISRAYEPVDLAKAEYYAEQTNVRAIKLDIKKWIAFSNSELGRIYSKQGKYQKGRVAFETLIPIAKEIGDDELIVAGLTGLAGCETKMEGYAKALEAYLEVEKLLRKTNPLNAIQQKAMATNWLNLAGCYGNLNDKAKALIYLDSAYNYFNSIESKSNYEYYSNLGAIYRHRGHIYKANLEYSLALENYQLALEINKQINEIVEIANSYLALASLYQEVNEPSKAIEYSNNALLIIEPTNYNSLIYVYVQLGKNYGLTNDHKLEIENYMKALRLTELADNNTWKLNALIALSGAHLEIKDYTEALYYCQKAKSLLDQYGTQSQKAETLQILAIICLEESNQNLEAAGVNPENREKHAIELLNTAYDITVQSKDYSQRARASFELSKAHERLKNYAEALKYYKIYLNVKDSISGDKTRLEIARQEFKFYFDKKEAEYKFNQQLNKEELEQQKLLANQQGQTIQLQRQDLLLSEKEKEIEHLAYLQEKAENEERQRKLALAELNGQINEISIAALKKENELKAEKLSASIVQRNLFLVIGFLIIISVVFAAVSYRNLQAKRTTAVRNKISRDLHDDIGATLSSISLYTEAVKQKLEKKDVDKAQEIINIIGDQSREMIESMSDIVWAANPENDKFSKFLSRIYDYGVSLFGARNISFNFLADQSLYQMELKMDVRNNLFLICKEALNNAAKYSDCKNVHLKFEKNGHQLYVVLKDDGLGFAPEDIKRGNGLKNMQMRSEEMNGAYSLFTAPGKGTEIRLSVIAA